MSPGAATKLAPSPPTGFSDLVLRAKVELYACLHLLAERAHFVTGADWAAIALGEGTGFLYRAAAGNGAPDVETCADFQRLRSSRSALEGKSLVLPIMREGGTAGFFQLVSGRHTFGEEDTSAVARLAEMVSTALDHLDAAQHSQQVIAAPEYEPKPEGAVLWHAPDGELAASASQKTGPGRPKLAVSLHSCQSCGFPVSRGRAICMDCEERGAKPSLELLGDDKRESWISAHGYTVASILVSAVAAAIYFWLH